MTSFNNTKKQYWRYYKSWMGERTYCAILRQEVLITRKGWDHLIKGRRHGNRSIKDVHRRFKLLKMAKYIITNANKYSFESFKGVTYVVLTKDYRKNGIKVILKKNNIGKYYFFSVMDK